MGRHGYTDDYDDDVLQLGRWRAQVSSALRGKRGQRFLRDLIHALDALPEKILIKGDLVNTEGEVCALGALGKYRSLPDIESMDSEDWEALGSVFDIADQLAQETMYVNDERDGDDGDRWRAVREWAVKQLRIEPSELIDLVPLTEETP